MIKFRTQVYLLICMVSFSNALLTQENEDSVIQVLDSIEDYSYLSANLSFTTNNIGSKSNDADQTGAALADISFYHKSGFFASLMPSFYKNTQDIDFSLGYTKYFDSGFDLTGSYTNHSTTSNDSLFSGIKYNHNLNVSLGYFTNNLYLFVDGYSLHGLSHNYYLQPGLGIYLEKDGIFTKDDYLSIFPILSASFGTDFYIYEDFTYFQYYWAQRYMQNQGFALGEFAYQSIDVTIPLSYTISDYTFSITYMFTSPSEKFNIFGWENQSGFLFSLSYMLMF